MTQMPLHHHLLIRNNCTMGIVLLFLWESAVGTSLGSHQEFKSDGPHLIAAPSSSRALTVTIPVFIKPWYPRLLLCPFMSSKKTWIPSAFLVGVFIHDVMLNGSWPNDILLSFFSVFFSHLNFPKQFFCGWPRVSRTTIKIAFKMFFLGLKIY
jgi:hypothetical protein